MSAEQYRRRWWSLTPPRRRWRRSSAPPKWCGACGRWCGSTAATARRGDSSGSSRRHVELCQPDLDRFHVTVRLGHRRRSSARHDRPACRSNRSLINLLRNAIEAIGESGSMRGSVVIEAKVVDADFVEVRVADNGPGFPPRLLESAFLPLSSTKAEGLGIGLPLCRSIVEAHGGQIVARRRHRRRRHSFHAADRKDIPTMTDTSIPHRTDRRRRGRARFAAALFRPPGRRDDLLPGGRQDFLAAIGRGATVRLHRVRRAHARHVRPRSRSSSQSAGCRRPDHPDHRTWRRRHGGRRHQGRCLRFHREAVR